MNVPPYDFHGSLAQVDHHVPTEFSALLPMRGENCDEEVHRQLQNVLMEHLRVLKKNSVQYLIKLNFSKFILFEFYDLFYFYFQLS
jgi:hypothetical protein